MHHLTVKPVICDTWHVWHEAPKFDKLGCICTCATSTLLDVLYFFVSGMGNIDDQHRNTNMNNKDHLVAYILKVGISGNCVSANFFHFPPKFRLRTQKPARLHGTNASQSVCRLCFVFNINTSYKDLLYFDNLVLKTMDFYFYALLSIFLSRFTHLFRQFLEPKK